MACLPESAVGVALTVGARYAERLVIAIVNHCCCYICCFKEFQEELNEEESAVSVAQQDLQRRLDREKMNTREATETAKQLSTDTMVAMRDVHDLQTIMEQDQHCLNNSCPNWCWRYKKGKEADRLITTLKKLKDKHGNLPQELAHEVELPDIEFVQSDDFMPTAASTLALQEIMTELETDGVNIIGLYGMSGAGKSTLAKQVKTEAQKKELFDEYLFVTVSEKPETMRIQMRLTEKLRMNPHGETSTQHKASRLMLRLQDDKKKLLILDDVWEKLELSEIGIPHSHDLKNCKILLITRRTPVCDAMGCQKRILLGLLTEEEAWVLFKKASGLQDDSLTDVAKKVAKACGRLPLAIMPVGRALKGKTERGTWEVAYNKLREGEIEDIRDISRTENVYRSLKLSFEMLPKEETKKCLLLCAFYPKDHAIFVHELARYAVRLGIWEHSSSTNDQGILREFMEEVDELRNFHLLLNCEILESAFTMHDLVRDVVLKLGKRYSVVREPTTENLKKESVELQNIADKHFRNYGFTDTPNESFTVEVPLREYINSQDLVLYESAESALFQIINALTDGIDMIGLHGLTGVGKTSWAKQVADGAVRTKLFDECVFVLAPTISDIRDIQSGIASSLKLELEQGLDSTEQRATQLRKRLLDEKKKILVLDGVREELNLNEIGIPYVGNLKILITTARKSVCKAMKCQMKILLEPLTKDEERCLIDTIKNSRLIGWQKSEACKRIQEFQRSPGALKAEKLIYCPIGSAREVDAYRRKLLESMENEWLANSINMKKIWQKFPVEQQRCMVLCCLYAAEDGEISVEELGRYAYALGMYNGPERSIQHTMARVVEDIDQLSDYHFLFPATKYRHIQLHVAARNVALQMKNREFSYAI